MNRRIRAFALVGPVLGAAVAFHAVAADPAREVREAQKILAAGEYERAYAEYQRITEKSGNPLAYFTLALFHQFGWGRAPDRVAACRLHEHAAQGGIPAAEHFLGDCLAKGVHRTADPARAAFWFQRAADHGHAFSLCRLAELLIAGEGVAKDPATGLAKCGKAADLGVASAMVRMGRFYLEGDLGAVNDEAAVEWFERAARAYSVEGAFLLAGMLRDGRGRSADPAAALYWFEAAASQGYAPAYFPTAVLYFNAPLDPETGLPRPANLAKAYMWLSASKARSGDSAIRARASDMLITVLTAMPESWVPGLDAKVAAHFSALENAASNGGLILE
ncbi:MAG: tetratricopeptide repeat protein [Sphingomonadales bacterium]